MHVALLTCEILPEPDPDEAPLLDALQRAGARARPLAWDAPDLPPSDFDIVVIRATWNYPQQIERFLAFLEAVDAATVLLNPLATVRDNHHKGYLLALQRAGIPIVPTALAPRGTDALPELDAGHGIVIKPAVSCGSWQTRRFSASQRSEAADFLRRCTAERDMLVQPVLPAFAEPGERALVWIAGELTHGVRKRPRFAGEDERIEPLARLDPGDVAVAEAALAQVRGEPVLARVDLVDGESGPCVSEIECIEPSLFFAHGRGAADRLAAAILARR